VIWDAPGPGQVQLPVQPVLQLEDGSFVGSSFCQAVDSMVAFDSSGSIKWSVPNYYPSIATADGGVIGALAYSFDNSTGTFEGATFNTNGAATGLLASLPTYLSWKASYLSSVGSMLKSVVARLPHRLAQYGAVSSGNLTGNGTALVYHTIGLFWCGEILSGTCAGRSDSANNPLLDLGFLLW